MQWYVTEAGELESEEQGQRRQALERQLTGRLRHVVGTPRPKPRPANRPRTPSWWTDDEDASDDTLTAVEEMRRVEQTRG